jgi:FkbM family methyltransferase
MVIADAEVVTTSRGLRLALDPNDPVITGSLREYGTWEEPVAQAIDEHLAPGWTFLDLGAHVGVFAIQAAKKGNPVIAIEANPEYEDMLRRNARENGVEIESYACAVSDVSGPTFLAPDPRYDQHPSANYVGGPEGTPVESYRLPHILGERRPEFIKADIEGLEYAVFKDSPEILDAAKVIIFEVGAQMCERAGVAIADLITLLKDHRFDVTYLSGTPLDYQLSELKGGDYVNLLARKLPDDGTEAPPVVSTILLCAWRSLTIETAECMLAMRDLGWGYVFGRGDALIQRVRSRVVSSWYRRGTDDVFLMIDDDVVFSPEQAASVVALAREKRSIVVGAYPVKDGQHLACRGYKGQQLNFGEGQPAVEIDLPATGFMAVHRDVITAMLKEVPLCSNSNENDGFWPLFDTFWETGSDGRSEYLSEDYAFGRRAQQLGFKTWLDQTVILYHLGQYAYNVNNMPTAKHFDEHGQEVTLR